MVWMFWTIPILTRIPHHFTKSQHFLPPYPSKRPRHKHISEGGQNKRAARSLGPLGYGDWWLQETLPPRSKPFFSFLFFAKWNTAVILYPCHIKVTLKKHCWYLHNFKSSKFLAVSSVRVLKYKSVFLSVFLCSMLALQMVFKQSGSEQDLQAYFGQSTAGWGGERGGRHRW